MFSVIVIPGNGVVLEKREKLVPVLFKTFRATYCSRTSVVFVDNFAIKLFQSHPTGLFELFQRGAIPRVFGDNPKEGVKIFGGGLHIPE